MQKKTFPFSSKKVSCYFDAQITDLSQWIDKNQVVLFTDENVFRAHPPVFAGWKTIVIRAGEKYKTQETVDNAIEQLITLGADRKTTLVGVGGGVVTDITGFIASIFMRGVPLGFVPTSVLAMVDAAVGGKNGIDVGPYKNLVGSIRQPEFLLYDFSLLNTLPESEWVNGFAEVIKHACIKDKILFQLLEKKSLKDFQSDRASMSKLIWRNLLIKSEIVQKDEFESGERRLLNFGHTLGHAIENLYHLPHGHAIAIGMVAASMVSEQFGSFRDTARVSSLLQRYGLPISADIDAKRVSDLLRMDKKRIQGHIHYVMLESIGSASVKSIAIGDLEKMMYSIVRAR